jgi:hypothetical protein
MLYAVIIVGTKPIAEVEAVSSLMAQLTGQCIASIVDSSVDSDWVHQLQKIQNNY